jgi:CheY-like chemotaxis protein
MGAADNLERELPYLRRYARAVTGSGSEGDALVEQAVVSILESAHGDLGRVEVFGRVETAIQSAQAEPSPEPSTPASSDARRAFLLTSMEGFSIGDVAEIMKRETDVVRRLIAQAEENLTQSLATDVFIIEDEPLVAAHIAQIAGELGHTVVGQAVTCEAAVRDCLAAKPSLLLADVQLADGSSGAEAAAIISAELDIPVIFITAFPQKLLTGRHGEPVYLIPKPFRSDMVKAVVSQALIHQASRRTAP